MSDHAVTVRAGINIHPDEPHDVILDLKLNAISALVALDADLAAEKMLRSQDDLALEAAEAEVARLRATLIESVTAAEAEIARLREALEDLAMHGTLHDCNPTVMIYGDNPEWMASHQWWCARAASMDDSVRRRAGAALSGGSSE